MNDLLKAIQGGLIVSCQALPQEPLHGSEFMAAMAVAAETGGAVGLRANGVQDICAIKRVSKLPIIGIYKQEYPGYNVFITPTTVEVDAVMNAGADMIAVDATCLPRPDGLSLAQFIQAIRTHHNTLIMGDVSTLEEGKAAADAGVDLVSTTLSGYTPHTKFSTGPDFLLLQELVHALSIPVIAEGRIAKPEECMHAFHLGAFAVVVGSAITRPQEITRRFVEATIRWQERLEHGHACSGS